MPNILHRACCHCACNIFFPTLNGGSKKVKVGWWEKFLRTLRQSSQYRQVSTVLPIIIFWLIWRKTRDTAVAQFLGGKVIHTNVDNLHYGRQVTLRSALTSY